nr:glycine--tRNA ligase subunit beta [Burkholderiales bacterium]
MAETLLVEIFTEELPPKALARLGQAFADGIFAGLKEGELLSPQSKQEWFATPRRLAVSITDVLHQAPDRWENKKLMPAKVAFAADGQPSQALLKRLEKEGYPAGVVPDSNIKRRMEGDTEYAFLEQGIVGSSLVVGLSSALEA